MRPRILEWETLRWLVYTNRNHPLWLVGKNSILYGLRIGRFEVSQCKFSYAQQELVLALKPYQAPVSCEQAGHATTDLERVVKR